MLPQPTPNRPEILDILEAQVVAVDDFAQRSAFLHFLPSEFAFREAVQPDDRPFDSLLARHGSGHFPSR